MADKSLIIDCDAQPFCPDKTWRVRTHLEQGQVQWDPQQIRLWHYSGQENMSAHELLKRLEAHPELVPWNANMLAWLLTHPERAPSDWAGLNIWFPATSYHVGMKKLLHIRGLNVQSRGITWVKKWVGKSAPKSGDEPIPYFDRTARIALIA